MSCVSMKMRLDVTKENIDSRRPLWQGKVVRHSILEQPVNMFYMMTQKKSTPTEDD